MKDGSFLFIQDTHSNIIPSSEQNFEPYFTMVIFPTLVEVRTRDRI